MSVFVREWVLFSFVPAWALLHRCSPIDTHIHRGARGTEKARFRYVRNAQHASDVAMRSCQYSPASGCCLVLSPRGRCSIDALLSTHTYIEARSRGPRETASYVIIPLPNQYEVTSQLPMHISDKVPLSISFHCIHSSSSRA